MYISLIIPVHDAYRYVRSCLKSVLKNFDFSSGEVIVVDDCSTPRTARFLKRFTGKHGIHLIKNSENIGYLKSYNLAVTHAKGDIVVLLNSDCEIPYNFSKKITECFKSDEKIIVASPVASFSANYFIPEILPFPIMNRIIENRKAVYPDILNAEGFCFCVRKSYIEEFGLFDPVYGFGYCEEVDFCFGVQSRGKRCVLIDNLYVKHARHKSFGKTRDVRLAKNNKILYAKWGYFIHKNEFNTSETPIFGILRECFGPFKFIPFFILKIMRGMVSNRCHTLSGLFKKYSINKNLKKAVYTAIVGNSDIIPVLHNFVNPDWEYICFTDNKTLLGSRSFGHWQIRPLEYNKLDNTKNARWHKTHPHVLFRDYEETLWLDANINILTPYIFDVIRNSGAEMLVPTHYCRKSIYDEAAVVCALSIDLPENITRITDFLKAAGMPDDFGLNETNIIYRKNSTQNKVLMEDWWFMIENYSKRDQLSFSYVLWKNGVDISKISIPNARIDVENFKIYSHNPKNTITGKILSTIFK